MRPFLTVFTLSTTIAKTRLAVAAETINGDLTQQVGKLVHQPAALAVTVINNRALQYFNTVFFTQHFKIIKRA